MMTLMPKARAKQAFHPIFTSFFATNAVLEGFSLILHPFIEYDPKASSYRT
jgi:hypothetical protein